MNTKTKIWVKIPCDTQVKKELTERFDQTCMFGFEDGEMQFPYEQVEVIIGEPDREEILAGKNIKWIQLTWAGVDKYIRNQDIMANITLTNASGAFGKIIAEYVIGMIISLYRDFPVYHANQREHVWMKNNATYTIYGKQVLILGTGDIGRNIAHRLKGFEAHVTGIRRRKADVKIDGFEHVYDLSSLDDLIPEADIVIGCLPGTAETKGLIGYDQLKSMKKDAVLINVGRGSLIDTDALIEIMKSGHLKGVALDVLSEEPLNPESALWDMENVIITPHIAGPSFGGNPDVQNTIWKMCMENIDRYVHGRNLMNVVDFSRGY